jgi:hypothetical protein
MSFESFTRSQWLLSIPRKPKGNYHVGFEVLIAVVNAE